MQDIHSHKILILDFGSQYTQLIARRVRELGVFSEVRAFDITEEEIFADVEHSPYLTALYGIINQIRYQRQPFCSLKVLLEHNKDHEMIL